ncbi:tRNA methyltransferase ppm2 [Paecilomyces lecythidis]|uniref:tRNA wybutosine-synthesizing protein 4 n=1 Tax=Paecilomyces lecythidis TaxID=3004212 RepID=A0ABR3XG92_9EURO
MAPAKTPAMAAESTKAEKEADLVMGTNNSSIVSKRSVELLYYPQPHFFRYFVKKPQRRAPLINRGYWLRMYAMTESVRRFLEEPSDNPKFVLNLGCGFDPLPFQLLSAEESLCKNATFVDIDYEKLMINKRNAIERTTEISSLLKDVEFLSDENAVLIRSKHYVGVGCDLKNLKKLEDTLRTVIGEGQCSILCTAEVSLTYIDVESADALIKWTSSLGQDVRFALLEQFFPDGPDHPFAATMMKHFNKLRAPLHSIHHYPSLHDQERRFLDAGWGHARARSLWELWSDNSFLSSFRRMSLDTYEVFDEWEEFALFASHYFLLSASTGTKSPLNGDRRQAGRQRSEVAPLSSFRLIPHCPPRFKGQRRYGVLVPDGDSRIGHHGGQGVQSRLATSDIYTSSPDIKDSGRPMPPQDIAARICHSVTSLNEGDCLLVGGRASPTTVFGDCWLMQNDTWIKTHDLPTPLYRHSSTKVSIDGLGDCVLVYGGKSAKSDVLGEWILWNAELGWQAVEQVGYKPTTRFGACMACVDSASGVLFGGITQDGIVLDDFWTWKVSRGDGGSFSVELSDQTENVQAASPLSKFIGRFGATLDLTPSGLVVIGGICRGEIIPAQYEILLLNVSDLFRCINYEKSWDDKLLSCIDLGVEFNGPRPLLTGHVSCPLAESQILVLGGGAVCFSFGTCWNEGTWILQSTDSDSQNTWSLVSDGESQSPEKAQEIPKRPRRVKTMSGDRSIPRISVGTASEFERILEISKPVVIHGTDVGPCVELWTKEYLTNTVGIDRKVVVHEAQTENMNFQTKNFSYITKAFGTFLDEVYAGGRQYLRSISAEKPTKMPANLAVDFPELKEDFRLPAQLSLVTENMHSSPLRVSGPVTMWLHYDVMANVYCQVRGRKRMVLYPPSDVQYLQLPPGASSSTIDVFQNGPDGPIICIPDTSPHEVLLEPGDILFIPPLWLHTAAPLGEVSIAVNVFFRNLTQGYAPGRDVYGNRDLQAYEKGRNDVVKIARAFDGLPPDMARFYLLRLADELREKAEHD